MLPALRRRLTFANTVSLIALFVALGGTSYAVIKLPGNSVGAREIKRNAVRSGEVMDRSLLARDFKRGQLQRGAAGPAGPQGAPGASAGPAGSMVARVRSTDRQATAGTNEQVTWPVTGNTWTQGAEETNFFAGTVEVVHPATCSGAVSNGGAIVVSVADGVGFSALAPFDANAVETHRFESDRSLASTGTPTSRTVTVRVSDDCTGAGENFTFDNLRFDVGAFR